jgi:hypothetical protein
MPCRFYRLVTTSHELLLKFDKTFAAAHQSAINAPRTIAPLRSAFIRARHRVGKRRIARIADDHLSRRKGWNFMARST